VLNLFIGVVVNAMQEEAEKAGETEREAERVMLHEETAPVLAEVKRLRDEVAALHAEIRSGRGAGA
jgi:voltage-gated sodium channel